MEVPTDGKLQVRVPIKQDDAYQGPETFELKASNTGGKSAVGTGTIVDDGTGTIWVPVDPGNPGVPPTDPTDPGLVLKPVDPQQPGTQQPGSRLLRAGQWVEGAGAGR